MKIDDETNIILGICEILNTYNKPLTSNDRQVLNGLMNIIENYNPYHNKLGQFCSAQEAEIFEAIENVFSGRRDEVVVKNVRNDLEQYGGNNNIAFLKGNDKGGVLHLKSKHNKDIPGVIKTLLYGKVIKAVPNRKVYLEYQNYLVLLSLDYFGKKKTWLLTGYEKEK